MCIQIYWYKMHIHVSSLQVLRQVELWPPHPHIFSRFILFGVVGCSNKHRNLQELRPKVYADQRDPPRHYIPNRKTSLERSLCSHCTLKLLRNERHYLFRLSNTCARIFGFPRICFGAPVNNTSTQQ